VSDIPSVAPLTPAFAPQIVNLPLDVNQQLQELWQGSFTDRNGARVPQEVAATLVRDRGTRKLSLINRHTGSSGSSDPDRNNLMGKECVGSIHTHPYTSGVRASFDAADASEFAQSKDLVKIVQSGRLQFMYMRTAQTKNFRTPGMKKALDDARAKLVKLRIVGGLDPFLKSTEIEAREIANLLGVAYYEGENGNLKRVVPRS
jgi:hypothetical protein